MNDEIIKWKLMKEHRREFKYQNKSEERNRSNDTPTMASVYSRMLEYMCICVIKPSYVLWMAAHVSNHCRTLPAEALIKVYILCVFS